jgi:ParB/RepB/Spo0J family partition protein
MVIPSPIKPSPIKRLSNKIMDLNISDVYPTKDNEREFRDPAEDRALQEMAANIREKGVLQPVLVRKHPTRLGKYELRAGERRLRGSKLAGKKTIPAIVLVLNDEEAMEVTVIENLHREDLTPLEQARSIQNLLSLHKGQWTAKTVAAHLGMTAATVLRRARLTALTKEWAKAMEDKLFPQWGTGHYELIARFDDSIQKILFEEMNAWGRYESMSLEEFERHLADKTRFVQMAKWDIADETLVPEAGACNRCEKRSACKPGLFDDHSEPDKIGKKDRCLDWECWKKKDAAFFVRRKVELQKENPGLLSVTHTFNSQDSLFGKDKYEEAKKKKSTSVQALMEDGPHKGDLIWVNLKQSAGRKAIKTATGKEPAPTPLEQRRLVYTKRRNIHVLNAMFETLSKGKVKPGSLKQVVIAAASFGTQRNNPSAEESSWKSFDSLTAKPGSIGSSLWPLVLPVLCRRLKDASHLHSPSMQEAERIGTLLSMDVKALHAEALEAIPDPKVWASLNENGTPKKSGTTKEKIPAKKGKAPRR